MGQVGKLIKVELQVLVMVDEKATDYDIIEQSKRLFVNKIEKDNALFLGLKEIKTILGFTL